MSTIDKQRIAAIRTLEAMGYVFRDEWIAPAGMTTPVTAEADAMHVLLVLRADTIEGSQEEAEFKKIAEVCRDEPSSLSSRPSAQACMHLPNRSAQMSARSSNVDLSLADVTRYLDEIERDGLPTRLIGFTGGE